MRTALLISNVTTDDPGGRAADFDTREEILREHDWEQVVGEVPEPYLRTFLPSIVRAYRRGRRTDADIVVSVSNPFHLQLVGFVVSLLLRVPWVVEFRDPMVVNPDRDPDDFITKVAKSVEWLCVHRAERVVWTDGIQVGESYYRGTYPDAAPETFVELPFKGYERGNFEGVEAREYDQFTITYAGSFYEGWIEPYRFIEGLCEHVESHGGEDLRVQFYGDWNEAYQRAVEEAGLGDVVSHHEFVPHEEIVPVLKGSDLVLYVGGDDPDNRLNVPSKVWDYVGARTPILAVVDPSFRVAELIEGYDLGLVVDPEDTGGIAEAIAAVRSGEYAYDPDPAAFEFTRAGKFERLAELYREVAAQ